MDIKGNRNWLVNIAVNNHTLGFRHCSTHFIFIILRNWMNSCNSDALVTIMKLKKLRLQTLSNCPNHIASKWKRCDLIQSVWYYNKHPCLYTLLEWTALLGCLIGNSDSTDRGKGLPEGTLDPFCSPPHAHSHTYFFIWTSDIFPILCKML